MQLKTLIVFNSPEARNSFAESVFLFDAAERASAAGFAALCEALAADAIKRFNAAKDIEAQARGALMIAGRRRAI